MTGLCLAAVVSYILAGSALVIHCIALVLQGRRERSNKP